jgi:hypothetical protein
LFGRSRVKSNILRQDTHSAAGRSVAEWLVQHSFPCLTWRA